MKKKRSMATVGALMALSLMSGNSAFAETKGTEDPIEEAQAFLTSPTSMSQAIAAAEAAAGGKVSGIEFQSGEDGAPDLIMADVVLADGTEKTVAINPADGKVMKVSLDENDQEDEDDSEIGDDEQDGENADN
ncbi:MAG: hypothetical protein B7Y02_10085 [Rhodobacterales bacterium 17-64-5]|nr:MAG: hypothetical protein B7Y02_10085 [Rhodobacterales bacterium 17-64-5]